MICYNTTFNIRAVLCVEGSLPHHDLMGNDGIAVDITFLGDSTFTKMLRCYPQI